MSGNSKKNIGLMLIILSALLLVFGITYAIYISEFFGTTNQQLVVGDIYMHYNGSSQVTLNNMIPSDTYNEENYFEFTISGKNDFAKKDIYYEILLSQGVDHATRTTRIRDDLLKFALIEIVDGVETVVLNGVSFNELNDTRLWVNTINRSQADDIEINYRLYAWVGGEIEVGNTASADYDIDTWNNDVFASIKVGVYGDLIEKEVYHDLRIYTSMDDTGDVITDGGYAKNHAVLTFETADALREVQVSDKDGKIVNLCQLQSTSGIYTCEVTIDTAGTYRVYGVNADGATTPFQTIDILFDSASPSFNIYNSNNVKLTDGDIVDYEITDSGVQLNAIISNIMDASSGIKSIRYSLENTNDEPNYIEVDSTITSFEVTKQINQVGIYELIVEVEDKVGNITKKTVNYRVYSELDESDMSMFVIALEYTETIYDGTEKRPKVTLKTNNTELIQGTDYQVTYSNNKNVGVANVTITGIGVYGGNFERTFTILKATPTVTLSSQSDNIYGGEATTFDVQSNMTGTYTITSMSEEIATVSPSTINAAANSSNKITINGEGNGTTTIKVLFTPTDTNCNSVEKTYVITSNLIKYVVIHERLANDGVTYVVVEESEHYGKLGEVVTPQPNTYINYSIPEAQQLTLTENEETNVITYQYIRQCFGSTCEYCGVNEPLGECMYNEADALGLYTSGLETDTNNNTKRVIGTKTNEPDNYVCFGTTTDCTNSTYLHRIVSVTSTDHRVELIYPQTMGSTYWYASSYNGEAAPFAYDESYVKTKLDAVLTSSVYGYNTNMNDTTKWSDIIVETEKNSFGNTTVHSMTANQILGKEEGEYVNEKIYTAKLHLISLSDLLMSTGSTALKFSNDYNTIKTSWMYLGANEWTYHVFNTAFAYVIGGTDADGGKLCANNASSSYQSYCSVVGYFSSSTKHQYRASFDLDKDTLFCGGSGTSDDPIILGYGSCE